MPKFSSVKELDDEFNLYPNQFNPFIHSTLPSTSTEKEVAGNQDNSVIDGVHAITLPTIAPIPGDLRSQENFISYQFSTLITNLMQFEDKLFFPVPPMQREL